MFLNGSSLIVDFHLADHFCSGKPRAEWALDDIVIGVNESSTQGFQENFDPLKPEIWYMAMNALPRSTCRSESNALEFSKMGEYDLEIYMQLPGISPLIWVLSNYCEHYHPTAICSPNENNLFYGMVDARHLK